VSVSLSSAATIDLVDVGANCDYLVPSTTNGGSTLGFAWIAEDDPANIANWSQGTTGIGYDEDGDYDVHISTDVEALMNNEHPTIYIRLPFDITAGDLATLSTLSLNIQSDDGFIAYLNGARVASRQPPVTPDWDSESSSTTGDSTAVQFIPFDISEHLDKLKAGTNLLALHGLNASSTSSDFLISPKLVATDDVPPAQPRLVGITNGLSRPVDIQNAGDGSGRLFVVEKPGRVRIVTGDTLQPTPFLNIVGRVDDGGNEEGLLGLAFPPDFATKQHFYVCYNGAATLGGSSDSIISRFSVSAGNPDVADANSEEVLLRVRQPFSNHNGGQIQFSPADGFLYIGFGDGGSGNDPGDRASNPATLIGKMLRIDVEGPPDDGLAYAIPPSNPFVGDGSTLDEIWAIGMRNPYRFGFDRLTGDLYIGDVGQNAVEEMNFEPAGDPGGRDYGWVHWEGTRRNTGAPNGHRVPADPTFPVHEYAQSVGGCSIITGFVYRGSKFPRMYGTHFFSDYCNGDLRGLKRDDAGEWVVTQFLDMGILPTGFGEAEDGTLYVVADDGTNRTTLFRIEDSQDVNYLQNIETGQTKDGRPTVTVGVAVGRRYQLQISNDLENWTSVGVPVLANGFSLSFELPAGQFSPPRQFMRVAEL